MRITNGSMVTIAISLFLMFTSFAWANDGYVGAKACASCHQEQFKRWQGSHHDMAMRHANVESVSGNFDDQTVVFKGEKYRFFRRDGGYWVNIKDADGKFQDYEIRYTFGIEPLQQYMTEFPDGRIQLIPFAWDARPEAAGGQRWFHLYPDFTDNTDAFFWTNTGQNWNTMCADCHSTNINKGYDSTTDRYNTTWSEINVACEACHGPGQKHLEWAGGSEQAGDKRGFDRVLKKAVDEWILPIDGGTFQPAQINDSQQVLVCAQCHSRHTQISDADPLSTNELGDRYLLNLIESRLYRADGQVYDENYVYGSFLQSKMAARGVVCSNCHDPHSARLTVPKEQVCLQCHQSDRYNTPDHHKHPVTSAGAQCVNCHMPETTYMQIDARRDHRWHTPNPELEQHINSTEVCSGCHANQSQDWIIDKKQQWFGQSTLDDHGFAPIFYASDVGYRNLGEQLSHIAQNYQYSNIIRASALMRLENHAGTNALIAIARSVRHEDSNVRRGAVYGARGLPPEQQWETIASLLKDKVLAVRIEAAGLLVRQWSGLTPEQRDLLLPALDDYKTVQHFNADRAASHVNLGNVALYQGKPDIAEKAFLQGIKVEPYFAASYLNLAELYRRQQQAEKNRAVLQAGLVAQPDDGDIPFVLGLAWIRTKATKKAIPLLKRATVLAPNNGYYKYVYAIAIEKDSPLSAMNAMKAAWQVEKDPRYYYSLCEMTLKHQITAATQCLKALKPLIPPDDFNQLLKKYSFNSAKLRSR